jgi:hypothetical protein
LDFFMSEADAAQESPGGGSMTNRTERPDPFAPAPVFFPIHFAQTVCRPRISIFPCASAPITSG